MKRTLTATIGIMLLALCVAQASDDGRGVIAKNPSAAPDGLTFVFEANFSGWQNLWTTGAAGRNLRQLTNHPYIDEEPSWSPDGTRIAFASTPPDGSLTDLWSIRPDGAGIQQLTHSSLNNRQPAWSPDSTRIAFVSDRGGTNDIWLMDASGSNAVRLTTLPGEENHPSFSPLGDSIVFSETVKEKATLMTVRIADGNIQPLTDGTARDWNPTWGSPGILFSSDRAGTGHWLIWKIQPNGTGLSQLANIMALDPIWLPDGRIAFTDETLRSGALTSVVTTDAGGANKVRISNVDGFIVPIDIRPGGMPNPINLKSAGLTPVAILSTPVFDVPSTIDRQSITFGSQGGEQSLARCNPEGEDVNGDGRKDLVCHFRTNQGNFRSGDTIGILRARTLAGEDQQPTGLEGRDAVVIVPK